jgi:uncharacterized protein (TIGR02271 family)
MANTSRTVVAVFNSAASAHQAVDDLIANGFTRDEINITSGDNVASDAALGNTGLSGGQPKDASGGGISGFFSRMFGSDDDYSGHYDSAVQRGSVVVTVDTTNEDLAADILDRNGAVDIDESASTSSMGQTGTTGMTGSVGRMDATTTADQSIPVVREELQVGKRQVLRGGVRVHNRIVEQPVEEQVRLREEHVRVERTPVDRPATEADFRTRNEMIEVTETAEEAVVSKTARVVEEISIGKEATERTETVRDTVRHTDVDVERLGGTSSSSLSDYDTDYRQHFQTNYGSTGGASYDTYAPAYQYGSRMASDERYRGRNWSDVESTLRSDYERSNSGSTWEQMKDSVRYGWEKVTGRR